VSLAARLIKTHTSVDYAGGRPSMRVRSAVHARGALLPRSTEGRISTTKKDHMRAPVSDRRPRSGMTLTPRHRQSRPLPMSAVAVRRGQFGEFELRPVREHTVEALTAEQPTSEN
jgi:hypothetical protein